MSNNLQALIDKTPRGGILTLTPPRREVQGPVVIRQPLTLQGEGNTIWAERGPALTIQCSGVVLVELNVELTHNELQLSGDEACAILVGPKLGLSVKDVVVRGDVKGLDTEEGTWRYPRSLRLGALKAGQAHTLVLRLVVPVPCTLRSEISGLALSSATLAPGAAQVTIKLDAQKEGTRLNGFVKLQTKLLTRQIKVTGHFTADAKAVVGAGQVIDQPPDWDALALNPPPPAKSDPLSQTVQPTPPVAPTPPPVAPPPAVPTAPAMENPAPPPTPAPSTPAGRMRRTSTYRQQGAVGDIFTGPGSTPVTGGEKKDALADSLFAPPSSQPVAPDTTPTAAEPPAPAPEPDAPEPGQSPPLRKKRARPVGGFFVEAETEAAPPPDPEPAPPAAATGDDSVAAAPRPRRRQGDKPSLFG